MKDIHISIFINEVKRQCKFVEYAYQDIHTYLAQSEHDRVWYSIQSFLISTGNISKLLWVKKPDQNPRGQELRDTINLLDDSILKNRSFRDHFEHYDERLERWAIPLSYYIDSNISKAGNIQIPGVNPQSYMRNFDPDSLTLTLQDHVYEIKTIFNEVSRLLNLIITWELSKV